MRTAPSSPSGRWAPLRLENEGAVIIRFADGKPSVLASAGGEVPLCVRLDIAELSSLVLGAADAQTLHRLGLLTVDDPAHAAVLQRIFMTGKKPLSAGGL